MVGASQEHKTFPNKSEIASIHDLPLFASVPTAMVNRFHHRVSIEYVPERTLLFEEGRKARALYVLLEGLVQLFTSCRGRERTVLLLRPTASFPVEAAIGNYTFLTSARIIKASRIGRIAAPAARLLFRKHRGFAAALIKELAAMHQNSLRELKNLRTRTSFQRLIAWILTMEERSGTPGEVELPYQKILLAERLGMAPETLSRDLARLADLGVSTDGRRFRIGDATRLHRFAAIDDFSKPPVP